MSFKIKKHSREDGTLVPIEFKELPFEPQRIIYVTDAPKGSQRGNHSHFTSKQVLLCLQGKITVELFNGRRTIQKTLLPHEHIFIPQLVWDSQIYETGNDIMMSIFSTSYDPHDHITDMKEFNYIINRLAYIGAISWSAKYEIQRLIPLDNRTEILDMVSQDDNLSFFDTSKIEKAIV